MSFNRDFYNRSLKFNTNGTKLEYHSPEIRMEELRNLVRVDKVSPMMSRVLNRKRKRG